MGIPQANQERIFDPFFSTSEGNEHSGLGLSEVRGNIESLHGAITLYSLEEVGTSFAIYLPLGECEISEPKDPESMGSPDTCNSLLIVQPCVSSVYVVSHELEDHGIELYVARDCMAARSLCERVDQINYALVEANVYDCAFKTLSKHIKKEILVSTRFDPKTTLWRTPSMPEAMRACAEPLNANELVQELGLAASLPIGIEPSQPALEQSECELNSAGGDHVSH